MMAPFYKESVRSALYYSWLIYTRMHSVRTCMQKFLYQFKP